MATKRRSDERETPFDSPLTLWERLIFPMLRAAYRDGWEQGSRDTVDSLREVGWKFDDD